MDTIEERLNDAQRFLLPLFKVERQIKFELDKEMMKSLVELAEDDEERNYARNCSLVRVEHPSGYSESITFDQGVPNKFEVGKEVSEHLYHVTNPSFFQELTKLRNGQLQKHGLEKYLSGVPNDPEFLLSEGYHNVESTISMCGGFAYLQFKGMMEEAKQIEEELISGIYRLGKSKSPVERNILRSARNMFNINFNIARQLYEKKGNKSISDLASLTFNQARTYLLLNIEVDVLEPQESLIGKMSTLPLSKYTM